MALACFSDIESAQLMEEYDFKLFIIYFKNTLQIDH